MNFGRHEGDSFKKIEAQGLTSCTLTPNKGVVKKNKKPQRENIIHRVRLIM